MLDLGALEVAWGYHYSGGIELAFPLFSDDEVYLSRERMMEINQSL